MVTATKDVKTRQNHNRLLLGGFLCVGVRIVARPHFPALPAAKAAFQRALHAWYRRQHRRLPWRVAPSLYRTVVSEFMLQQTQVATVLPYFERWLRELPDFTALAAASEAKVSRLRPFRAACEKDAPAAQPGQQAHQGRHRERSGKAQGTVA